MAKCLVEDFATFHNSDFISTLKFYFSVLSPSPRRRKLRFFTVRRRNQHSQHLRGKNPSCARGEQCLKKATITLKRFHINSKCDWVSFLAKRSVFPSHEMQENYVSCLVSLSNWKFLGFPSSSAHHSPSFPHADQKSRRIDNRCWYWFHKFNKKRCARSCYLCFKKRRNKTETVFSWKFYSYVTVPSGVVNVDTNGVIKILLIKNYDAGFEVCLNFVSN